MNIQAKQGKCFSCCQQKALTEEHIIPQALGGKYSAWIYCKDCNDNFGREIDSELVKNLGYFSTILEIDRDRGKNQPYDISVVKDSTEMTHDGKKLARKKPVVKIEKVDDNIKSIDIRARSESELDKIIEGVKRKYKLGGSVKKIYEEHPGPTDTKRDFVFDNSLIRRAVAKIVYSLICIKLPESYVLSVPFDNIREYIRFGCEKDLAAANFTHTDFMTDYTRPLHKIHISLNRCNNLVAGFVCLFGTFRYTVLVSDNFESLFEWPGLDYTFDPVTSREIFGNPNFKAPELNVNQLISPRHSKQFVLDELSKGHKILESYIEDYQFLKMELDH